MGGQNGRIPLEKTGSWKRQGCQRDDRTVVSQKKGSKMLKQTTLAEQVGRKVCPGGKTDRNGGEVEKKKRRATRLITQTGRSKLKIFLP